jgi:hypothetical protein
VIEVKAIVPVLAALAATGCATTRSTEADIKQQCTELYANQQIDPVRDKIQLPISLGTGQPIEMLANRTTPSAAERPAVLAVSRAFQECNQYSVSKLGTMPSYRAISNDRVTEAMSRLYADELTYGGFARELLYIGERDQLAAEELNQALRAQERWQAWSYE